MNSNSWQFVFKKTTFSTILVSTDSVIVHNTIFISTASNDVLCDDPAYSGYCNATTAVCFFSNSGDFSCACKSGDVLNPYDEQSRSCIGNINCNR